MKLNKSHIVLLLATFTTSSAMAVSDIERASIASIGANENTDADSREPSVSADGRYVAFESAANDIVGDDTFAIQDIFRYDRQTDTSLLVSRGNGAGGTASDTRSLFSDMSDDGRYIVFASRDQGNLVSNTIVTWAPDIQDPDDDVNVALERPQQIFLRDMTNNTTTLISVRGGDTACAGTNSCFAGNSQSTIPTISADGRYVVYESLANDILAADTDTTLTRFDSDIYRYEIATGTTSLVSTGASGKGNSRSLNASISDTGQYVVFASDANNLGGNFTDGVRDVFLRDMVAGTTIAVTNGTNPGSGSGGLTDSQQPTVSSDGSFIAFESYRQNIVDGDTNGVRDVFVYHTLSQTTIRVSVSSNGVEGDGASREPEISSDGRFVVFDSSATNLITGDTNGQNDVFVRDLASNTTTRVSTTSAGAEGTGASTTARISTHGDYVVFSSFSSLVTADTHAPATADIYLYINNTDIENPGVTFIPKTRGDFNGDGVSDVLWRNRISGANKIYIMSGLVIRTDTALNVLNDNTWEAQGMGDFNNDKQADIFWRNTATGATVITFMNGTVESSTTGTSGFTTDLSWEVVGVGDFDSNNFDDVLIRNNVTGEIRIAFMSSATVTSEQVVGTLNDLDWNVAGIGDFDNDNKDDILWRHNVNRSVWMYLMDGNTITNGAGAGELVAFTSDNWDIPGVGDFDNDGMADILWRHNTNGRVWMYLMNGNALLNSTDGEPGQHVAFTSLEWDIAAVGDYNGDSKTDIFWRHGTLGTNHHYHMNGVSIITNEGVNTLSDLNLELIKSD
ncbi:MAG: FG-GAP-like repeat-containing protein [Gammaproteobacteria bacterium]